MIYDDSKIAIIACVNDKEMYEESLVYIKHLEIPQDMTVELIQVQQAVSMTSGYQEAMESSDAKYKIYMHQDCFPCNRDLLYDLLKLFRSDSSIGMIGVAGCTKLPAAKPVWWCSSQQYGKVYTKPADEYMHLSDFGEVTAPYISAAVVDGVFMATQYDLPWRSDLFDGWHFYDVSQSREFINSGYKVVIPRQEKPWLIHFNKRKILDTAYNKYAGIFMTNYSY